jgi:hypothetical protein
MLFNFVWILKFSYSELQYDNKFNSDNQLSDTYKSNA